MGYIKGNGELTMEDFLNTIVNVIRDTASDNSDLERENRFLRQQIELIDRGNELRDKNAALAKEVCLQQKDKLDKLNADLTKAHEENELLQNKIKTLEYKLEQSKTYIDAQENSIHLTNKRNSESRERQAKRITELENVLKDLGVPISTPIRNIRTEYNDTEFGTARFARFEVWHEDWDKEEN